MYIATLLVLAALFFYVLWIFHTTIKTNTQMTCEIMAHLLTASGNVSFSSDESEEDEIQEVSGGGVGFRVDYDSELDEDDD